MRLHLFGTALSSLSVLRLTLHVCPRVGNELSAQGMEHIAPALTGMVQLTSLDLDSE